MLMNSFAWGQVFAAQSSEVKYYKIGILANRGKEECLSRWKSTVDVLNQKIPGMHFAIVPLGFDEVDNAVEGKQVDFALTNAFYLPKFEKFHKVQSLVTLSTTGPGPFEGMLGGVIFTRANRQDINEIHDLKGKSFAATDFQSVGWIASLRELRLAGLHEGHDLKALVKLGENNRVVEAVQKGEVDAATIRTGIFEQLVQEGKIRIEDFKILHPRENLPFICSTRLYPEWVWMRLEHVPMSEGNELARVLLSIPKESEAARTGKYQSWMLPLNSESIHDCLKELRISPYESFGIIQFQEVFQAYWPWMLVFVLVVTVLIIILFILSFAGRDVEAALQRERSPFAIWIIFFVIAGGIIASVRWYYVDQKNSIRENHFALLNALSNNSQQQITEWFHEMNTHLTSITQDPMVRKATRDLVTSSSKLAMDQNLPDYFKEFNRRENFDNASVLDIHGKLLWTLDLKKFNFIQLADSTSVQSLLQKQSITIVGPDVSKLAQGAFIDVAMPLLDSALPNVPYGILVLTNNLEKKIYPLLREWPMPTHSGEMMLARREGDKVVFISPLRFSKRGEAVRTLSMNETNHPAVMAARGMEGNVEGVDYRNVKVLAVIKKISETPWYLIAKMDENEVYEGLQGRHGLMIGMTTGSILLVAAFLALFMNLRDKRFYKKLYQMEKDLSRRDIQFYSFAESSLDLIYRLNRQRVVIYISPAIRKMLGYNESQILNRRFSDLVHRDYVLTIERAYEEILKGKPIRNLEIKILKKNGEFIEGEVNASPIFEEDQVVQIQGVIRDISERKHREEELRQSEEKFKLLAEGLQDVVMRISVGGKIEYCSPAVKEFGGYDSQEEKGEFIGKYFANPLELVKTLNLMKELTISRKPSTISFFYRSKNTPPFMVEVSGRPLIKNNQVVSFMCVMRDISQRVKAEMEMRKREATLNTITSAAQDAIVMMDDQGLITFWNPAAEKIFEWTRSEALGKNLHRLIVPERYWKDHEKAFPQFQNSGEGAAVGKRLELFGKRKSGNEITVELSLSAIQIEGHWNAVGIMRDITERKIVEEKMRWQHTALESAANGIVILNVHGQILWVNPAFQALTGYSSEEAIGKNPRILKSGKHDASFYKDLWDTILAGKVWCGEIINKRKDGSFYTEEMTITPVKTDTGISHFIAIKQDITSRKQYEEKVRRSQRMESVGMMAGGVAHDFNNILTVIGGYLDLVMMNEATVKKHTLELTEIKEAVQRASQLVKRLLVFSRKEVSAPKVFEINVLIQDLEKMLTRLMGEHIELSLKLKPGIGNIKADPSQVEQVIVNLVVNARDAMPNGGKILIEASDVILDEDYSEHYVNIPAGHYVLIAIQDNGTGMSDEVKEHLFEPFFTTKPKGKGTGLGLSMCFGIMRQSHGHISVYSEVGHGTVIKLYFPKVLETGEALICQKTDDVFPCGNETILVVEDEGSLRKLAVTILSQQGYVLHEAENGLKALSYIESHPEIKWDLIVTDVIMPQMNGRDLAAELWKRYPKLKILFMSGYTDDAMVRGGIRSGAIHFLQKPFTRRSFSFKIREVLDSNKS